MEGNFTSKRIISAFEILFYIALYYYCFWVGVLKPGIASLVASGLLLVYPFASNLLQKKSAEEMGFSKREFYPALILTAKCSVVLMVICGLVFLLVPAGPKIHFGNVSMGSWVIPINHFYQLVFLYSIYAFIQQYILMGFLFNRLQYLTNDRAAAGMGLLLFVAAHIPNPILLLASLVGGMVFFGIFLKHRNIIPLAILHAVFGAALFRILYSLNPINAVGKLYLLYTQ